MGSSATPYLQVKWQSQNLDQNSAKKASTMVAMLTRKLPLIVIVAPSKLYSE